MKIFKASKELVSLLLQYGFSDQTPKLYPHHYYRLKEQGYDPYSMKRIFCYHAHQDYLLFHYLYITLHHTGTFNHTEERRILTAEEVRSLITFYQLPATLAHEWLEAYTNAFDLHKYYRNICLLPEVFNTNLDKTIKQMYEGVQL